AALFSTALLLFAGTKPWVFMWTICFALYFGCKWLTWRRARIAGSPAWRHWAYLWLWPGLDARAFLDQNNRVAKPAVGAWLAALAETLFGVFLLWGMAGSIPAAQKSLQGWIGMAGIIFMLHFGAFHLLALMWQRFGVNARPLMRAPVLATSLADFWGRRWNSAFNRLAHDLVYRPLHRRLGAAAATMAVFLVSGLVHDLVISVPARAGYGLPTCYFLLQGTGLLLERSELGQKCGLRRGLVGRCYTVVLTAVPAYWLFHPAFVKNVILPMLHAIGAT
ncbi:MAG TPA: membrane bound O-acyl transferase family-domain-containing protein, partial [Verrucomicrobiae bacterium]|nr:membrane bound O-acyl transferase family-domain-containing protein [Verrucomicrobiae bacterium]